MNVQYVLIYVRALLCSFTVNLMLVDGPSLLVRELWFVDPLLFVRDCNLYVARCDVYCDTDGTLVLNMCDSLHMFANN